MILLVEHNRDDAERILGGLHDLVPAERIRHATDSVGAIDMIQHWRDTPLKLVLLDVDLGGDSGFEVLEQLRNQRQTRHVPVVMLSNSSDENEINRSYDLGANSVVNKSTAEMDFSEVVSQVAPYWLTLNHPCIRSGADA